MAEERIPLIETVDLKKYFKATSPSCTQSTVST